MQLILVRHAEAVDAQSSGTQADEARVLTPRGQRQADGLKDAFRRLGLLPDVIASSPAIRAKQTADALGSLLPTGSEITVTDKLAVDQLRPRKLSKEIVEYDADTVVIVGHMPDLGIYAAWLLGAGENILRFEKAGAARVLLQRDLSGESLAKEINDLIGNSATIEEMEKRAKRLGRKDAAKVTVDLIEELAGKKDQKDAGATRA